MSEITEGDTCRITETVARFRSLNINIRSSCSEMLRAAVSQYERSYPRGGYGTHFDTTHHLDGDGFFYAYGTRQMSCE